VCLTERHDACIMHGRATDLRIKQDLLEKLERCRHFAQELDVELLCGARRPKCSYQLPSLEIALAVAKGANLRPVASGEGKRATFTPKAHVANLMTFGRGLLEYGA
jgi:hypothetical protein